MPPPTAMVSTFRMSLMISKRLAAIAGGYDMPRGCGASGERIAVVIRFVR